MKYMIFLSLVIIGLLSTYKQDNCPIKSNAEIIGFDHRKCMCCWGWIIKIGNDTIKSDDNVIYELVGYEIKEPIKVYIKLGEYRMCKYYNIKEIRKVE